MFKRTIYVAVKCRLDEFFGTEEKALDRDSKSEISHVHIDENEEYRGRKILEVQPIDQDVESLKVTKSNQNNEVTKIEQSTND